MSKITVLGIFILAFMLTILPALTFAKSDNSNSGQGKSSVSDNTNRGNSPGTDSRGKSDNNKKDSSAGSSSDNSLDSDNSNRGKSNDSNKKSSDESKTDRSGPNRGSEKKEFRGAINISKEKKVEEATPGGKVKKLEKVKVREASESAQSKRRALQGLLTGIDGFVLTIVHQIHRERTNTVLTDASTQIHSKGSKDASSSASLAVGQRVIVVGDLNSSGQLVARVIKIIPGNAFGIFKKNPLASGSATPNPSNTATPSASVSPSPVATNSSSLSL